MVSLTIKLLVAVIYVYTSLLCTSEQKQPTTVVKGCLKTTQLPPAKRSIYDCDPNSPSGLHWRGSSPPEVMYCAMNLTHCGNTTGRWTRVAHIDMKCPGGTCPSPLKTIASPHGHVHMLEGLHGCSSVFFSTLGVPFTEVCGKAIG